MGELQVRDGGLVFFRESCFRQSGDVKRSSNPTHYRNPRDYFAIFDGVEVGLQRFSPGCGATHNAHKGVAKAMLLLAKFLKLSAYLARPTKGSSIVRT